MGSVAGRALDTQLQGERRPMPRDVPQVRRRRRVPALILCSLLGTGCSHLQGLARRSDSAPGSSSTLGTDFKTAPKGQTIPPAGFGVDLVGVTPEEGPGPVRLASASPADAPLSRPR